MPVDRGDGKAIPGGSRGEPGLGLYYFLNHVCYSSRAHCYHVCYHIGKARAVYQRAEGMGEPIPSIGNAPRRPEARTTGRAAA